MERSTVPWIKAPCLVLFATIELLVLLSTAAHASASLVSKQLRARGWAVSWDDARSVVEVAYGGRDIDLGFIPDSGAAVDAARLFFSQNATALGTHGVDIRPTRVAHLKDKWNVSFSQYVSGIRVEGAECSILFTRDGVVRLFGSNLYPNVRLSVTPTISRDEAILVARRDVACRENEPSRSDAMLAILPDREGGQFLYALAWEVTTTCECPYKRSWLHYVDASSGVVIRRDEGIWNYSVFGTVTGKVQPEYPFSPSCSSCSTNVATTVPIAYERVRVYKGNPDTLIGYDYTDADGHYSVAVDDSAGPYKVKSSLVESSHFRLYNQTLNDETTTPHHEYVGPAEEHNWTWAGAGTSQCDWEDAAAAINVFYHLNVM